MECVRYKAAFVRLGPRARQELFCRRLLLCSAFLKTSGKISALMNLIKNHLECDYTDDYAKPEEDECNYQPNHTPNYCVGQDICLFNYRMYSPRDGKQPQVLANALASEVLTLRRIVSSSRHMRGTLQVRKVGIHTNNVPQDVHARHDPNE